MSPEELEKISLTIGVVSVVFMAGIHILIFIKIQLDKLLH